MSEKITNSLSIETYLTRHENLLLEHIRRMLQAETKITLLESALQEMYKKNEDLTQQVETTRMALDQAINGLSAVTNERNSLSSKTESLETALTIVRADLNNALVEKSEVEKLQIKLDTLELDYDTLKINYLLVLEQYNSIKPAAVEEQESAPAEKKKRQKNVESEWVDGQY